MPSRTALAVIVGAAAAAGAAVYSSFAPLSLRSVDTDQLRQYAGVYRWEPGAFIYLQLWNELSGTHALVAFDENGEIRTLYPTETDRFFTGPGAAVSDSVESRIEFHRDNEGRVSSLSWRRGSSPARAAERVDIERHEDVRFANGDVQLAGTLIRPASARTSPAVVLVHGSGAADRMWTLPYARFLVRHGLAVLGYDKRGVGESTGDWNDASFDDLAGDVVAAVEYLKTRDDVDAAGIGLLGVSQAGWVMPLAAVRAKDVAFVISIAGPGVAPTETMLDHARHEMTASGLRPPVVTDILHLMTLQHAFARTGDGWDTYAAARSSLERKLGRAPDAFPATRDHAQWRLLRRLIDYDPAPALHELRTPTLALFGELDNNILPEKNRAAWAAALMAGGHPDYTLAVVPRANHLQLEATVGTNAEMKSLRRFVPAYFTTVRSWLAARVPGFGSS